MHSKEVKLKAYWIKQNLQSLTDYFIQSQPLLENLTEDAPA